MAIKDILDRLEAAERGWLRTQFLAPLVPGRPVTVRIAGIVCTMRTLEGLPRSYAGWAVFEAISTNRARFVRDASLAERERYLALFPRVRLILVGRGPEPAKGAGPSWLALPAQAGDRRFQIDGLAAALLPEEGLERFDTVAARYDGRLFWYDRRDAGRDPAMAAYLREQIAVRDPRGMPPETRSLRKRGLSAEERAAYAFVRDGVQRAARDSTEERLSDALAHAQGRLQSYTERGDLYTVTYEVDGRVYTSAIRRDDLTVMASGICLSGEDAHFDLTSLVGVMREAADDAVFD